MLRFLKLNERLNKILLPLFCPDSLILTETLRDLLTVSRCISVCNVIRKIVSTNYNDEIYHVSYCLEDAKAIF